MNYVNTFSTKDFYIGCVLLASKVKLLELQKNNSEFVTFVFSDPSNITERIIAEHWSRELKVVSRDLIDAINELKTRIYSKK